MPEIKAQGGATGAAPEATSPPLGTVGNLAVAEQPPAQNPPNVVAALSALDLDAIRKGAAQAERVRIDTIGKLAASFGQTPEWAQEHITKGTTVDAAGQIVIADRMANNGPLRPNITVGEDQNKSTIGIAIQDAILARVGLKPTDEKKGFHERSNEFQGCTLIEMMKAHMGVYGVVPRGWSKERIVKAAYQPALYMKEAYMGVFGQGGVPGHSTSDFPYLLENTVGKLLRAGYEEAAKTWPSVFRKVFNKDFKDMKRVQISAARMPPQVYEGGEYTDFTVTEGRETYFLRKYGQIFRHTWEMMVNDDMDAFSRIPRMMGLAHARLVNKLAWERWILAANGETMADGAVLFIDATHRNKTGTTDGTGTALSVASLGVGRSKMRSQLGMANELINIGPRHLIVPPALETTADQLISSTVDPAKSNSTPNPFQNRLQVVVEAELGAGNPDALILGDSDKAWYLAADSATIDTGEVCFLEGQEAPFIDREEGFVTDGVAYKSRQPVAAKQIEWRSVYKNAGA